MNIAPKLQIIKHKISAAKIRLSKSLGFLYKTNQNIYKKIKKLRKCNNANGLILSFNCWQTNLYGCALAYPTLNLYGAFMLLDNLVAYGQA